MSRRVKVSKLKEAIRVLVLQELNEQENDKPEHFGGGENIDILGFQTKHFDICKSAVILYQKLMEKDLSDEAKELVVSSAKEMDHLFEMEKQVVNGEEVDHDPVEHGIELTNIISFQLGRVAEMIGEDFERDTSFIKMHVMEIVKRHKREVDEVSTTATAGTYPGGPGHYFTPFAFSGGRKKDKKKRKKIATAGGYKPVNESQPFADFPQFPKLSRAQQESLDELFGFAESYQIYNAFEKDPKKFIKTLDDMANIRKASNKKPKGVNFNKGKKEFVKEEKGLGKTLGIIIYNGILKASDTLIIGAQPEPIVTRVRSLLRPKALDEIRDPRQQFDAVKVVGAAAGLKVVAPEIEGVVAGAPFFSASSEDEIDDALDRLTDSMKSNVKCTDEGVVIRADAIGSLEALAYELSAVNIPIVKAVVGDVSRRDVVTADPSDEEYRAILAFNVKVHPDAKKELHETGVKIFESDTLF